jgi:hypothetical protein
MNPEQNRLDEANEKDIPWRRWGPYLSERQWGTVREDYSDNGDAWNYFPHDHARSRIYKWGEDGLAGISDDKGLLCWALALWNGKDPILKERLFGLTNAEGNHGEDAKEYYYYLDSTPTHSYMKYLYKYPQNGYPYEQLIQVNRSRNRYEMEFELIDTGIFDEDRYFDVFVEYAKASPEDLLIKISAVNRGPENAVLHILPQLWFRNTWWRDPGAVRPEVKASGSRDSVIQASYADQQVMYLYFQGAPALLFTENETNTERLRRSPNATSFVKDAFHEAVIWGKTSATNPAMQGTKSAGHYLLDLRPGETQIIRLRLASTPPTASYNPFDDDFDAIFTARCREADKFYAAITPDSLTTDQSNIMRQALAGMLWSKQFYTFDLDYWLDEHGVDQYNRELHPIRNRDWSHMINGDIISMPDKWEYPWYAAWDLAFHTLVYNLVDPAFARHQLGLMLTDLYLHPNGQIPAYEWNFSDVNPPIHAWATVFNYMIDQSIDAADFNYLKNVFNKLVLNFNWWLNRKDPSGRNIFSGGFLGLDNIGIFDRSAPLPTGGYLEQADGTAWMAFYSLAMLQLALGIARQDPSYEEMASRFIQHFLWIAGSMDRIGEQKDELWDEAEGFFYDVLILPDGSAKRLKVNSLVGLLPLTSVAIFNEEVLERFPGIFERTEDFIARHPELLANIHPITKPGVNGRRMLAVLNEDKLRRILARMLNEERFFSPYGIRSLSRWHLEHPYVFDVHGEEYKIEYLPAESNNGLFGGNSNWRGPIWFPMNILLIRGLVNFYTYYGDDFKVECPTGSGQMMTLFEVAHEISKRLARIFEKDPSGRRPVFGGAMKFQEDPNWQDYLLFYEYFHGDNGAGLGASHQTGWTGLVAALYKIFGELKPKQFLAAGTRLAYEVTTSKDE